MAEESTDADLLELAHEWNDAFRRRELRTAMSFYASNAVFEGKVTGDRCEGRAAILDFFEGFIATFDDYEVGASQIVDLGNGVVFVIVHQRGRLAGSTGEVRMLNAHIVEFADRLITRHIADTDIDAARAAAERLAEERA